MTDEQTGDSERLSAGLDAAVQRPGEDRYGFTHVAKQLALAIEGLSYHKHPHGNIQPN